MLQHRLTCIQQTSEKKCIAFCRKNHQVEMTTMEKLHLASRLQELEEHFSAEVNTLEANVLTLSDALDTAKTKRDELADCVTELESQKKKKTQSVVFRRCPAVLHRTFELKRWYKEHRANNQICAVTFGKCGGSQT